MEKLKIFTILAILLVGLFLGCVEKKVELTPEQNCIESAEKQIYPEKTYEIIKSDSFPNFLGASDFIYNEIGIHLFRDDEYSRKVFPINRSNGDFTDGKHPVVIVNILNRWGISSNAAICNVEGHTVVKWVG